MIQIILDTVFNAPIEELDEFQQLLLIENEFMRNKYNEHYYTGCNPKEICYNVFDRYWYTEGNNIVNTVMKVNIIMLKKKSKVITSSQITDNLFFITLTSKEEWTEIEAKAKIDKYRTSHFKKYKYIYTEEHGTDNSKYHQHILVKTKGNFHTGQNLRPTKYYDANINVKKCTNTQVSINNLKIYMSKENKFVGDIKEFE